MGVHMVEATLREALKIRSTAQFNDLRLVHEHILFVAGCNIVEACRASPHRLSARIMQVSKHVMGYLPGCDRIRQGSGANVRFLPAGVENAPRRG